ncbi:hypothetical protein BaRGS_00028859 [Batillaria attramentaria]|uniref:Uncharacterized protein n=1 Tax=Batillaria attramentaria TaxID=370345 RepID=A0ABD0JXZ2_9CAEN
MHMKPASFQSDYMTRSATISSAGSADQTLEVEARSVFNQGSYRRTKLWSVTAPSTCGQGYTYRCEITCGTEQAAISTLSVVASDCNNVSIYITLGISVWC